MDDLNAKINSIMSDPEKLKEIQKLGQMMGLTGSNTAGNTAASTTPDLSGIFNSADNSNNINNNQLSALGGIDPQLISKFAPLLMSLNQDDETTRLFDALIPFLSPERKEKLQKIRKMMVIMKLLPNLRGLGIF